MTQGTKAVSLGGCTRRNFLRASGLAGLGAVLAPGLWASEPHPIRMPYNTLSDEEEIELGKIFAAKLERQIQIVDNSLISAYLNDIVESLAKVSQRPNLPYNCKLVNIEEINAFSIPGGGIYLNRGLVEFIDREDELVATLSHEIGHVVARHATNQLMLTFRARQVYQLVKDNILSHSQIVEDVIDRLGGALAMLALLHFSRENELEADMLGFYEMLRAGYQPSGFLDLFERLNTLERSSSMPSPILRDHPPAAERASAIRRELTEVSVPKGANEDSLQFHAFRLAMNLLPPAPPSKPASDQQ
jgi:beta-barrel assembly-enhancing protease